MNSLTDFNQMSRDMTKIDPEISFALTGLIRTTVTREQGDEFPSNFEYALILIKCKEHYKYMYCFINIQSCYGP